MVIEWPMFAHIAYPPDRVDGVIHIGPWHECDSPHCVVDLGLSDLDEEE